MTIAVTVKVHDGLVLAADSASTVIGPDGVTVITVYNHANKLFNLYKGLPIAGMTWGAGSIGKASISTLAKDLRRRLMGADPAHSDWKLDPENYSMESVAKRAREFLYEELYVPAFEKQATKPAMGFAVAGYSSASDLAEEWRIDIKGDGSCAEPIEVRPKDGTGMSWNGEPEAITRLVMGHGVGLPQALADLGVPKGQIAQAVQQIQARLRADLILPPMPIQDAIDVAEFLVHTTVMFSRFTPGAPTVGGPIEIAAVTKHEGFRWIKRKFFFDRAYNPGV